MKRKPLENPKLVGCLNCSPVPENIFNVEDIFSFDCGDNVTVYIADKEFTLYPPSDKNYTINSFIEEYKEVIERVDAITIEFESALHSEKYEYNKEDENWYLVDQGMGYA